MEAHGTGTILGDPIEVQALGEVFATFPRQNPCYIGSVKTNIGHLETAAGIAGLIKIVLAMQHEEIPPHLHFKKINPHIPIQELPFQIPVEAVPWKRSERPRIAAVSSYGFGGTNAHVVIQEGDVREKQPNSVERDAHILTFSGTKENALVDYAGRYLRFLEKHPEVDLADVSYTANAHRAHFAHRVGLVFRNREELIDQLKQVQESRWETVNYGKVSPNTNHRIAFLFTGQGAQYVNMGKRLYETQPTFRKAMDACNDILLDHLPQPLLSVIFNENPDAPEIHQTQYTQPALFAIEYALAQLWRSWGIEPHYLIGHSVGEYVAACIAGVFSLEDGLKLIAARGRLMQGLPEIGSMAAVFADAETVTQAIAGLEDRLSIAGVNGVANTVISGEKAAVKQAMKALEAKGFQTRLLRVSHAFHSPLMEEILDEFESIAKDVTYRPPQIPIVSNVTGKLMAEGEIPDARYWRNHIRQPVLFAQGMQTLADEQVTLFIETGPHPTLIGMARQTLSDSEALWLPSLNRKEADWNVLLTSVARLYAAGGPIDWVRFDGDYNRMLVDIPHYPFQRKRYWKVTPLAKAALGGGVAALAEDKTTHPLLGRRLESPLIQDIVYESTVSARTPALLGDHRILNTVLFPAAGFVEVLLAAAAQQNGITMPEIHDFTIRAPLVLAPEHSVNLQVALLPAEDASWTVKIFHKKSGEEEDSGWEENVTARLTNSTAENGVHIDLENLRAQFEETLSPETFYARLRQQGFQYGRAFQAIKEIYRKSGSALARLEMPEEGYYFHPGLLDGGFQLVAAALEKELAEDTNAVFLPVGIQTVSVKGEIPSTLWCRVEVTSPNTDGDTLVANVQFISNEGVPVAEVTGLQLQRTRRAVLRQLLQEDPNRWLYRLQWEPKALSEEAGELHGLWLVFAPDEATGKAMAERIAARGGSSHLILPGDALHEQEDATTINPANPEHYRHLLQKLETPPEGILHLWAFPQVVEDTLTTEDILERQNAGTRSVLHLAQELVTRGWNRLPTLWLITQGAQAVQPEEAANPVAAPLWGLARTMRLEFPELPCKRVDLENGTDPFAVLDAEIGTRDGEDQIAYRNGQRYVARLVRLESPQGEGTPARRLEISQKGLLDNLELVPVTRQTPPPGTVEIRVHAAGLNFRDVLNALDLYPGDPGPLGGECAGVVSRVGEGVTHLKPGDPVMAIAGGSFADYVVTHAELAVPKPKGFSFEDAATIPITFLTAYYALIRLGGMKKGDKVLIHVASGGVGQAAIQLAKMVGAEIFATAGSDEKRAFLRNQGIRHVMNSRTLDFADEIMRITNGEGVDLILNSLNGDYIPKGLSILSKGGRFLEIGKVGIWTPEQVKAERPDVRYFTIALDDLSKNQPQLVQELFRELLPLFENGTLKPLPKTVYSIEEAVNAFRFMQQARHIGKVVISLNVPETETISEPVHIRADGAYLITGGTGGLGMEIARWLVQKGAGEVVLTGRKEPAEPVAAQIDKWNNAGARVRFHRADVSNETDVQQLVQSFHETSALPLKGIFHAAGVLDDGVLLQQEWERFLRVFAPKVNGSWNLHRALKGTTPDFIVYFSSMASLLGSPGQSNYAAANAFMDSLSAYQRAAGLRAISINWGPWADVGMAARTKGATSGQGLNAIDPEIGMELLETILTLDLPQVAVLPIQWKPFLKRFEGMEIPPVLSHFAKTEAAAGKAQQVQKKSELVLRLEEADPEARHQILVDYLRDQAVRVLGLDPSVSVDPHKPLSEMGLDSLMAIELKNALDKAVGQKLPATMVFNYPTIDALAGYLLEDVLHLKGAAPEEVEEAEAGDEAPIPEMDEKLKEIEDLSDEEVEKLLLESLEDTPAGEDDSEEDEDDQ